MIMKQKYAYNYDDYNEDAKGDSDNYTDDKDDEDNGNDNSDAGFQ